ncbi:MAG TPA: TetR/AcrR family transcriptional regulator [Acidimicrobiales bacterium]|nr:TetR/AcrR family transcriptional regulator [Acidimicrobiales bacterium]
MFETMATGEPPTPRTRRRVPREVRISEIARIAEDLFGQFGYQGTSMDDVARLAGVSKPVVYDLVGSKEQLFKLCLARTADELASRVATAVDAASADERLRAGALAFFRFVDEHRPAWRGLLASGSAPLTAEITEIRRNQASLVAGLLMRGESMVQGELMIQGMHGDSSGPCLRSSVSASATDRVTGGVTDGVADAPSDRPTDRVTDGGADAHTDRPTDRVTDRPTDRVTADALANAINGAFEALAGWWQSHPSVSTDELAELMVQLMGPGLETMAGVAAGGREQGQ